jgi:hypothetical protein
MSIGYIYVLSNPTMPGLVKIGFTNRDVKERAGELSAATGVPQPFEIEYHCLTRDVEEIESSVQAHFASKRVPGKEFFSVELVEAVELIDSLVKNVEPDRFCRRTMSTPSEEKVLNNRGAETFQDWQKKRDKAEAEEQALLGPARRWGRPREKV